MLEQRIKSAKENWTMARLTLPVQRQLAQHLLKVVLHKARHRSALPYGKRGQGQADNAETVRQLYPGIGCA